MTENSKNELENLYRNAAENFPLITDSANWQVVLKQLEDDKKKFFWLNRRTIAIMLLLIVFSVGFIFIATKFLDNKTALSNAFASKEAAEKQLLEIKTQNKNLEKTIADKVYKKVIDSLNKQNIVATNTNKIVVENISSFTLNSLHKTQGVKISTETGSDKKVTAKKTSISSINKKDQVAETIAVVDSRKKVDNNKLSDVDNEDNSKGNSIAINDSTTKVDTAKKDITTASVFVLKSKKSFTKYFYVGAMYASQKCSVQSEGFNGDGDDVGYNMSFLVGYKFSKIFSIETGISLQSKEYYTTSNDFNKNVLQATGNVLWVEAENKLIEIPISLKIDLLNKKQHSLFANIGVSSYIVNKEIYEYEQELSGVHTNETVQYKTATSNFLGAYNFSFGYQYQFKKIGSIRVEPYLSIPLNGVGRSNQPIVSKGIYFGWVYNFKH